MDLELNEQNLKALAFYLEKTLNPDADVRRNAEVELLKFKGHSGYGLLILALIKLDTAPMNIRMAAATMFKNYVKSSWEDNVIKDAEKAQIREILPPFMLSVPRPLQKLISAALKLISDIDFPDQWHELLPSLVKHLQTSKDFSTIIGILKVLDSIFKRYRHQFNTDDVLGQLKYILQNFAEPLLQVFKLICEQIDSNINNPQAIQFLFTSLKIICNIFYSLNAVDLPEQFEDNLETWMNGFIKFLNFQTQLECLVDASTGDEPELLHKVQAAIISNVGLYMEKYETEFTPYLSQFVTSIWHLLISMPNKPKYDPLVTIAIQFLTTVSKSTCYTLFSPPEILQQICQNVVIPNIKLRKSDIEIFTDNPQEYVRFDMEGSDIGTRRRSAYELVKGLRKNFEMEVTNIFANNITQMLNDYANDPDKNWQSKDAAIYLLTALAVTKSTQRDGVLTINAAIPIRDFYTSHILPELSVSNPQKLILIASCLNFLNSFRRQFVPEDFPTLLSLFINYLAHPAFVIHTYAAICVEQFLITKNINRTAYVYVLPPQSLGGLLTGLFNGLQVSNSVENNYIMKAISRVLSLNKNEAIFPYLDMMLSALNTKLEQIYKSPSNPEFGYFIFESISCVVSVSCKKDPSSINRIEAVLLPVFSKIVTEAGADVYSPFVFQLLSYFLETRKSLPDGYKPLIKELLNPIFWEQSGNLPALTRLVQAFLSTGADYITSSDLLVPILGVFQKLVSSKINDYLGFYIAEAIVQYNPLEKFNFALQDIFRIIFTRVQGSKTTQLVRSLLVFFSFIICFHGPKVFTDTLRQLQPNLVLMVFQNLWIPNIEQVKGRIDRKICTIAMAKVLNEWPDSRSDEFTEIRIQLGKQMQNLMEGLDSVPAPAIEEDLITDEESGKDYTSGFTNLSHVSKADIDPFPNVDPKTFRL